MAIQMPTGAKAMSAVAFAVVGWLIANSYIPNMPEGESVGWLREMVAAVGAIVGWKVMGTSVGKGYLEAAGSGLKTVIILVFFSMLLFGIYEMLLQSVRMMYDGPIEAIIDIFGRMLDRAPALLSTGVLVAMIGGGIVGGLLAENANRRWR